MRNDSGERARPACRQPDHCATEPDVPHAAAMSGPVRETPVSLLPGWPRFQSCRAGARRRSSAYTQSEGPEEHIVFERGQPEATAVARNAASDDLLDAYSR